MKKKFKIISCLTKEESITINIKLAKELGIERRRVTNFCFGDLCIKLSLSFSSEINENEILISSVVIEEFRIPIFAEYELKVTEDSIVIGPFIGILATHKEKDLDNTVHILSNYLYDYKNISGAILAFSSEGIDSDNKSIRGYVYNHNKNIWEKGVYSYPKAIFRRAGLNTSMRKYLKMIFKNRFFNDYMFDKWEMYQYLKSFSDIKNSLPETRIYKNARDIKTFLELYKTAYIKPISGSQGKGIIWIIKKVDCYIINYIQNGQNRDIYCRNYNEMKDFIEHTIKKNKYLIQKSINLMSYNEQIIDFRLLIVKDYYGEWCDMGMIARYGIKNSIVSNVSSGGSAEIGEITLKKVFHISDEEVFILRKRISNLALKAAKALNQTGINCGNLGVDIGIDEDKNIWIIEINNKDPNHTIAIDAGDRQMFYRVKRANMLYAKRLSGF